MKDITCIECMVHYFKDSLCEEDFCDKWCASGTEDDFIERIDRVQNSTSAEPKTGKWILEKRFYNDFEVIIEHCSECGVRRRIGWQGVAFCPNCGAKMDEGGDTE